MITEQKLAELRLEYPNGAAFSKGPVEIYCRKPNRGERLAFLENATSKRPALSLEKLVRAICVFPEREELDRLYDDEGFILDEVSGEVMDWLRGGNDAVTVKKF
ncbi:hypothetical protein LZC95_50195 [Pendulispora brunnea]|uniref:Uncharacterized protein n=1 Tax=Pendulispora brunnea TaxID=2905690 RepID=A0ABZ2K7B4_9BACT